MRNSSGSGSLTAIFTGKRCEMDPVNAFLDQRQPFDDAPTFGQDAGADRIHHPVKGPVVVGHHGDPRRHAGAHVVQVGFAEVRDHIPAVVIQQGEDRLQHRGVLANGGFQRHHHAVERRAHSVNSDAVQRGRFAPGPRRVAPPWHPRRSRPPRPVWPAAAWPPARPRRFLSGARLIEIFTGSEPCGTSGSRRIRVEVVCLTSALARSTAAATDWALYSCALMVRWVSMICASRSSAGLSRHRALPDRGGVDANNRSPFSPAGYREWASPRCVR